MSTPWDEYWTKARGSSKKGLYEHLAQFYRRHLISKFGTYILNQYLRDEPDRHYLHAGCGSGGSDQWLQFKHPTFHELDYSLVALQMNRDQPMMIRREYLGGDLLAIPYKSQSMDGIFNFGVMEHFEEEQIGTMLAEFRRVLKPGGNLVMFWPPVFGLSVMVLSTYLRIVNTFRKTPLKLYPDEVSRLRSFRWVRDLLGRHGFKVTKTEFGWRDLFTQVAVVAQPSVRSS